MTTEPPGVLLRTREPFVVMAKSIGPVCNLDCTYCYYLPTASLYEQPHQFRMSQETLETYVRQFIEASPGPTVPFFWHGGEPTLAGMDFYRRAVDLQRQYLPEGWECWNNLQTNGTLLDDEWCAFLAAEHFDVGISIDGTRWLHDANRKDRRGRGSYDQVLAAVRRLQVHGIQPDLLCTVTAAIAREPVAVYESLRALGTGWMQFIPIVVHEPDGGVTPESVVPEDYGRFLSTIFDLWMHRDIGELNVQYFAEILRVWAGGEASVCWLAPSCGRVLVVEHDGAVYSCDHFVDSGHLLGNLGSEHLGTLVDRPRQQQFGAAKRDLLPGQCRRCQWLDVCNGACPKDRFVQTSDGEPGLNYLCDGMRAFCEHVEQPARHMIRRVRAGAPVTTVMSELRAMSKERWAGVGRNDPCICHSGRKAKACCWAQRP